MKLKRLPVRHVIFTSSAMLMIQGIADAGIADRQTVFDRHIENAKRSGWMPDDFPVIRKTMDDYGFVMQSTRLDGMPVSEGLDLLGQLGRPATVMIQTDSILHPGGFMHTFRTDGRQYTFVNTGDTRPCEEFPGVIMYVWIRFDNGIGQGPFPRRKYSPRAKSVPQTEHDPETGSYLPFRPNPSSNYVGDCVIRALAGAMNVSWEEALDTLTSQGETTVNDSLLFKWVLHLLGFVHHDQIMRGKRRLRGWEFCEEMTRTYHHGERIFAYVGAGHVAAIAPVRDDSGASVYKVLDSWDSSNRLIGEYWVSPGDPTDGSVSFGSADTAR